MFMLSVFYYPPRAVDQSCVSRRKKRHGKMFPRRNGTETALHLTLRHVNKEIKKACHIGHGDQGKENEAGCLCCRHGGACEAVREPFREADVFDLPRRHR